MTFFRSRRNLGMLLLGIWLIAMGAMQCGVHIPYDSLLAGGVAVVAGVLILLDR